MKNLIVFIFCLFSFNSFNQTYEMYSDVWEYVSSDSKRITPKGGGSFSFPSQDLINKIDTNKINSYMLESLNEFRKDYGKSPVTEDKDLTKMSKSYAKCLSKDFKHDPNLPNNNSENIAELNFMLFTKIDLNKYDINKVIADCCFDIFIRSNGHMGMLLDDKAKKYGFGIYKSTHSLMICVRYEV
jgi:uncharacterized protein YkwD